MVMADTKVETISRLAQWKIDNFGPCSFKKSDPFKIGIWNWHLSIEKTRYLYIRLFPEPGRLAKEQPPLARFVLRVTSCSLPNRRPYTSPVQERVLRTSDDLIWPVDCNLCGRFVVDVEFLDLRIYPLNSGEPISIWPGNGCPRLTAADSALGSLSRMLQDGIHADVTINTAEGSIRAHKAVLASSSPVFQSMFLHNLREKESSTIDIEDMSWEACMVLLRYLYGSIKRDEFWKHRLVLLGASNKYDIRDLKGACEDSLLEDISTGNVLERLHEAWLYGLEKLKKGCLTYLFDFGKIYDVKDEIGGFFRVAERDLVVEMFQEVLNAWKPV